MPNRPEYGYREKLNFFFSYLTTNACAMYKLTPAVDVNRETKEAIQAKKEAKRQQQINAYNMCLQATEENIKKSKANGFYKTLLGTSGEQVRKDLLLAGYTIKGIGGHDHITWDKPNPVPAPEPMPQPAFVAPVEDVDEEFGKVCCVCLEPKCDACFHPCAHTEICFACAKDLKTCPMCRAEGYAKQIQ